jgi:hypothetical protein
MTQSYTQVTVQGFFGRIGSSIVGVFVGIVFLLVAVVVLFWNEGRAVRTARMLKEAGNLVVTVDSGRVDPSREGKLVHFTADAKGDTLTDPLFHVSRNALRLKRTAEMYQWKEAQDSHSHNNAIGGGSKTTKTYTYSKVWSTRPIDSSTFQIHDGHENPTSWRIASATWAAPHVQAGAFTLPTELVNRIDQFEPVPLTDEGRSVLPKAMQKDTAIADGKCYVSGTQGRAADPADPQVGDVRVALATAPPGPVSVIGEQTGTTLAAYTTPSGGQVELLYVGAHPAKEMIATEQRHNTTLTWILRLVGFVMTWIAIGLVLQPLKIVAGFVDIIGDLVGVGLGLIALLGAATLSAAVIAIAWLVYRPLLGGSLLAVAAAAATYLIMLWQRRSAVRRSSGVPSQPVNPVLQQG